MSLLGLGKEDHIILAFLCICIDHRDTSDRIGHSLGTERSRHDTSDTRVHFVIERN